MLGYIYKTTNLVNGKIYIGQHVAAKFEPNLYIGSGSVMLKAIKKYGINNFKCELLAWAEDQQTLDALEIFYIATYKSTQPEIGYNLSIGGKGGNLGYKFTEEQLAQLSASHMGHHQSAEAIKKQADKLRGRIVMTDGKMTKLVPQEEVNKYLTAGWHKGRPAYSRSKKVVCYETGECFDSISQVLLKYPQAGALKRCLKQKPSSTCCGLHWYLFNDAVRKAALDELLLK